MLPPSPHIILGSRSPRRRELLSLLVPPTSITVLPPRSSVEAHFEGLSTLPQIEHRLQEIARAKCDDVTQQTSASTHPHLAAIITADTEIIVTHPDGTCRAVGQPPADASWPAVVRRWFQDDYAGQTHLAVTALCVTTPAGEREEQIVRTAVTFRTDVDRYLDWYLATGEPQGKAGGYALQSAGSLFIEKIEGSLTNVIGLPLEPLFEILQDLDLLSPPA